MVPDANTVQSSVRIFVGELSGIRLIEYEDRLLDRSSGCATGPDEDGLECIDSISGSPRIQLFVVPTRVIKGAANDVQELRQVGCTSSDMPLRAQGLFFVDSNGNAVIVWRSQSENYFHWLERLGVEFSIAPHIGLPADTDRH